MFDVLAHRAADEGDLAPAVDADVDRLLHAVHVRRERGDEDPALRLGKIWRNASPTTRSDCVTPGPLGVRRVAEQQVDAAVAELREPADVGALAVDRRVVELVVAGVDDAPARRLEDDRGRVGDRVRHAHELDRGTGRAANGSSPGETSRSSASRRSPCSSSFDLTSPSVSRVATTTGISHLAHQVRQRADVILVAVREHDAADHVLRARGDT